MDIISQLKTALNDDFIPRLPSTEDDRKYKEDMDNFFQSTTFGDLEKKAIKIRLMSFNIHNKGRTLQPSNDISSRTEKDSKYDTDKRRMHDPHQFYVYLIGLYIYNKYTLIKSKIDNYLERTSDLIEYDYMGHHEFTYSGGCVEREFNYRWMLASLNHDNGYPIELARNNHIYINKYIKDLRNETKINIRSFNNLFYYKNTYLLHELNKQNEFIDIGKYVILQYKKGIRIKYIKNKTHDHGIFGALILLRLLHEQFDQDPSIIIGSNYNIINSPKLLSGRILKLASSIAMHNLDNDEDLLRLSLLDHNQKLNYMYNLDRDPIGWLLKIVDEIQEFHRPKIKDYDKTAKPENVNMSININEKIEISGLPKEKNEQFQGFLKKYTTDESLFILCE